MLLSNQISNCIYLVEAKLADGADKEAWDDWYDNTHIPELLSVPGFRTATRYSQLHQSNHYLAGYEIDHKNVFEEDRYREVTGWASWAPDIATWNRVVVEVVRSEFPTI
jgi:hypothetical protein